MVVLRCGVACYVDRLIDYTGRVPYRHKVWCHLVADSNDELLACAAHLGLSEAWIQGTRGWDTHFDIPAPMRELARELGAVEVDYRFMGRRTSARRAAGKLGADLAVGSPVGAAIEVPLPAGTWVAVAPPLGIDVAMTTHHSLLVDRSLAVFSGGGEFSGIVTFADTESDPQSPTTFRIAIVLAPKVNR